MRFPYLTLLHYTLYNAKVYKSPKQGQGWAISLPNTCLRYLPCFALGHRIHRYVYYESGTTTTTTTTTTVYSPYCHIVHLVSSTLMRAQ